MSTGQTVDSHTRTTLLAHRMREAGMPQHQAYAVAQALEYALRSPEFGSYHGPWVQEHLEDAITKMAE